jgi:hypothetical protein
VRIKISFENAIVQLQAAMTRTNRQGQDARRHARESKQQRVMNKTIYFPTPNGDKITRVFTSLPHQNSPTAEMRGLWAVGCGLRSVGHGLCILVYVD